jgi:hypothetical protein
MNDDITNIQEVEILRLLLDDFSLMRLSNQSVLITVLQRMMSVLWVY